MTDFSEYKPKYKFLPEKVVLDITGFSSTTLWRRVKDGDFPQPVQLSPNRKGWPEHMVEEWAKSKMAAA